MHNDIKKALNCCYASGISKQLANEKYLIHDSKLEKRNKLLYLYLFLLDNSSCSDKLDANILYELRTICGSSICVDCEQQAPTVLIEEFKESQENFATVWVELDVECELEEPKWRGIEAYCEQQTIWVEEEFYCELEEPKWRIGESVCEQVVEWRPVEYACEQDVLQWRPIEFECEVETAWRPAITKCEQGYIWKPVEILCEQVAKWRAVEHFCEQEIIINDTDNVHREKDC